MLSARHQLLFVEFQFFPLEEEIIEPWKHFGTKKFAKSEIFVLDNLTLKSKEGYNYVLICIGKNPFHFKKLIQLYLLLQNQNPRLLKDSHCNAIVVGQRYFSSDLAQNGM